MLPYLSKIEALRVCCGRPEAFWNHEADYPEQVEANTLTRSETYHLRHNRSSSRGYRVMRGLTQRANPNPHSLSLSDIHFKLK